MLRAQPEVVPSLPRLRCSRGFGDSALRFEMQSAYPYGDLVETSCRRGRHESEYELLDTGLFDQDRYFDVFVEYAKASPEDILIQITVCNRRPDKTPSG